MRIAVVTGASSGMGREFVRQLPHFYRHLDEIWVAARREDKLRELNEICPVPVRIFAGDISDRLFYRSFQEVLESRQPDIRMLVNAAGFGKSGTAEEILRREPDAQEAMIEVNCQALTRMTFTCLPYLSKGSRVLNLASAAAFCPQPSFAVYAATKSYVLSFSRGMGAEWRQRGICVTAVCPGPVDTEFFQVSGGMSNPLKKLTMAKAGQVVRQALLDSRKGKSISVYGFWMKAARLLTRLVPHTIILSAMGAGAKNGE